ncbi:MAG: hypothetical protein COV66_05595 [Nitrospinae bacterium CG11_big_fil_rev_8_21_14_0_20_45_15]|nr:MAG: hypothetical protein COV66_05595 [Nitrospinae bacterium CG11_big_fil_rev_8_21_14_0_20_45_15]
MFSANIDIESILEDFSLKNTTFAYNDFVVRFYNFCLSLGFERGKMLPSRAFCSDENQGYLSILIAKQFGTFPFNHGRIGGIVATDRHDPHSEHGKDLAILQASHVGFDPEDGSFGSYHRRHTEHCQTTSSCGKITNVLSWYLTLHNFAKENIFLHQQDNVLLVSIDNQILNESRDEGLFLHLDRIIERKSHSEFCPRRAYSTSTCYVASAELRKLLGETAWPADGRQPIGEKLLPVLFSFKRNVSGDLDTRLLEENLIPPMPWIVSSKFPLLTAAQANTQAEFDRTFRTVMNAKGYIGKRMVFISGLNIDISPHETQVFPLTTFVPWAAYIKEANGHGTILEQEEIVNCLRQQNDANPDEVNLEKAIQKMKDTKKSDSSPPPFTPNAKRLEFDTHLMRDSSLINF